MRSRARMRGGRRRSAGNARRSMYHAPPPTAACPLLQQRTATHRKLHVPKSTKSSCVGVRTTGSQRKSWTTRAHGFHPAMQLAQHRRVYYPSADAPGLARSVEAALLSFPIIKDRKVPVSPQVFNGPPTRPRLRTHGRLAFDVTHSDWLPPDRGRYRPFVFHEDTVTARFLGPYERLHPARRT